MTQNLALKFSPKVDERFAQASLTQGIVNNDYDWIGVNAIKVYSINTSALNNYTLSGTSRYGTPAELDDTVQELAITQDKSFTFTIDTKFEQDQVGAKDAGRALRREIDEVIIPTLDKYRLSVIEAGADYNYSYGVTITDQNAYENVLKGFGALGNSSVPVTDRTLVCGYKFYAKLRMDAHFLSANEIAQGMKLNGQVGTVEGMPVVVVPDNYLLATTNFLIVHKSACVAPVKLQEYKTHINPPGISGTLVEGRIRHDAFVLANKAKAIYLNTSGAKPSGATGTGV